MDEKISIVGKIIHIGDVESHGEKFRKILLVIETEDNYPQEIPVELVNDRVALRDGLELGQVIKAHIDLRGRAWTPKNGGEKRWFMSASCWRIDTEAGAPGQPAAPQQAPGQSLPTQETAPPLQSSLPAAAGRVDEIPF